MTMEVFEIIIELQFRAVVIAVRITPSSYAIHLHGKHYRNKRIPMHAVCIPLELIQYVGNSLATTSDVMNSQNQRKKKKKAIQSFVVENQFLLVVAHDSTRQHFDTESCAIGKDMAGSSWHNIENYAWPFELFPKQAIFYNLLNCKIFNHFENCNVFFSGLMMFGKIS